MALTNSPSRALLWRDQSITHRDLLLDEVAMSEHLGDVLGWTIDSCELVRTKYRVGESLRVCYAATVGSQTHLIALRCFPSASEPGTLLRGEPDIILRDFNAAGWIFPRDRKLEALEPFWTDSAAQISVLGALPKSMRLVSYAPEKAATIQIELEESLIRFVKLAGPGHQAIARRYANLTPALARCGIDAPALINANRPLGAVVISQVSGPTLAAASGTGNWERCGSAAAAMHSGVSQSIVESLPPFRRSTVPSLLTAAQRIIAVRPDLGDGVSELVAWLKANIPSAGARANLVAVHGDLHAKNVVMGNDRVGLIDLDQASQAPAAAEIGSALAAIRYASVLESYANLDQPRRQSGIDLEHAFLAGYDHASPLPASNLVRWYFVAALLGERALRAVNRVRVGGLEGLPSVIEAALDTTEWSY